MTASVGSLKLMPFFIIENIFNIDSRGFKQAIECSQRKMFQLMQYIHHVIHGNYMHTSSVGCKINPFVKCTYCSLPCWRPTFKQRTQKVGHLASRERSLLSFNNSPQLQSTNELLWVRHFRQASENLFDKVSHLRLMTIPKVWESCNKRKFDLEN